LSPHSEHIRKKAERLTHDFSSEQWQRAPEGKWSAALIFEHLLLTFSATTKGTLKTMKTGRPYCREATWRDRMATFIVTDLGFFPSGKKATQQTSPTGQFGEDLLRRFNDALVAMDATLADAEHRFGSRTRLLDHPILGPLTAEQWRRFHRVHADHHFRQVAARAKQTTLTKAAA